MIKQADRVAIRSTLYPYEVDVANTCRYLWLVRWQEEIIRKEDEEMKRTIAIALILALVSSLGLVTAVPVEAATIDLEVNDENPWTSKAFTFTNVLPGEDLASFPVKFENVGSNEGVLTFSMSYVENDMDGAPDPKMLADEFASLVYVEAVTQQYRWPADPEKQPDGYIGAVKDDLPNWLGMDLNEDGKVSIYELKMCSPIPWATDEGDTLPTTASSEFIITFQLGDSLDGGVAGGNILTGVEDSSSQGDGISATITATLEQEGDSLSDTEQSSDNVFQAAVRATNTNTGLAYGTIQLAIDDASPGDTINVATGTYDEQVVIDTSLTLQGAGDTTVIKPSGPELLATESIHWIGGGTHTMSAIVSVETTGGEVTIEDLEIDGSLVTSKSTTWVAGLVYLETGGKVEDVIVNGGSTLPDRTAGIFATAITEPVNLEVTGCTVEVYTRAGIYALGEAITVDYHHNEINGPGDILAGVPNGMFFLEGANGSATYNIITDLGYTGEAYRSTGIGTYNAGADVLFAHNTISYVQNAFALSTDTVGTVVEYNDIFNNHTGVRIEARAADSIIQYNDIHDNDFAMRCGPEMEVGNMAHYNNFIDNPGLEWENVGEGYTYIGAVCNVHETYVLDATNNWWGTTVKDAIAEMVSANVDYDPWLSESYPPAPSGGGGGISKPPPGTTKVSGDVDSKGFFEEDVTATSKDEQCILTIPEGTLGLTEGEYPLRRITMEVMDEPPPPPEDADVIGLPYDFGPDGATFNPPITLTWSYDPDVVPEGLDLVIAFWDGDEWIELENCVIDLENNTITADVSHFTAFTVIARAPEVVVAPPVEVPEVVEVVPPEVVVPEVVPPEEVAPPAPPEPTIPPLEPAGRDLRWLIGVAVFLAVFFPVRHWRRYRR